MNKKDFSLSLQIETSKRGECKNKIIPFKMIKLIK
jgi:hypothetical protein